jgi:hypothetical protein
VSVAVANKVPGRSTGVVASLADELAQKSNLVEVMFCGSMKEAWDWRWNLHVDILIISRNENIVNVMVFAQ